MILYTKIEWLIGKMILNDLNSLIYDFKLSCNLSIINATKNVAIKSQFWVRKRFDDIISFMKIFHVSMSFFNSREI